MLSLWCTKRPLGCLREVCRSPVNSHNFRKAPLCRRHSYQKGQIWFNGFECTRNTNAKSSSHGAACKHSSLSLARCRGDRCGKRREAANPQPVWNGEEQLLSVVTKLCGVWLAFYPAPAFAMLDELDSDVLRTSSPVLCGLATASAVAFSLLTLLFSCRFMMSVFPAMERKKLEWPWAIITVSTDPFLEPARKVFKPEFGDLDMSATAGLAVVNMLQEVLFGDNGVLLTAVPDRLGQTYLDYLLMFQRGFLMPSWVMIVGRWMSLF